MTFDYKKYRKKIDSIIKERRVSTIKDLCIKLSEKEHFIESINDDAIEDVSVLIDFYPALHWLRNAMLKNGDFSPSRTPMRNFEFNAYDSLLYQNHNFRFQDAHFYYNANTMELFSLSNSNFEYNNSSLVPDRYKEMIDSKDSSIVELPKLNNIDLYFLRYHAVLKFVDTLDDARFAKFFKRQELLYYEFPPDPWRLKSDFFWVNLETIESSDPDHKKLYKKYYHESALLLQRFLNSSIFWFLNTIKDAHQLDLRSLLKKIKTSKHYLKLDDTVSTLSTKEKGKGPNPFEDDDLPF